MSAVILPPEWNARENEITPESVYQNRREFLKTMGIAGLGIAGALYAGPTFAGGGKSLKELLFGRGQSLRTEFEEVAGLRRNAAFTVDRPISDEKAALTYNNFYEFTSVKEGVWKLIDGFKSRPWQVEIAGHVEKPGTFDVDDLIRSLPVEERVYRHRCVERWAMVVPWNGFPMRALIEKFRPTSKARFVRFVSFMDPEVAPGQKLQSHLPWPYNEGLTLAETMNELTFVATGVYGHTLPVQHGAPLRIVTPWKYGYKSIKSIVKIEFTEQQPATFWSTLVPHEYPFESNVDPDVPHPRWSQRSEKMIGTGDVFATKKYNGYGKWVAGLYS